MSDPESVYIQIQVPATKRTEWKTKAKEQGYGTLTRLITDAVERELNDEYVHRFEAQPGTADVDLSSVEDGIAELKNMIGVLQESVDATVAPWVDQLTDDQLIELAIDVQEKLPTVSAPSEVQSHKELPPLDDPSLTPVRAGTVEELADHFDRSRYNIRQALLFLKNNPNVNVDSVVKDGKRHWYEQR